MAAVLQTSQSNTSIGNLNCARVTLTAWRALSAAAGMRQCLPGALQARSTGALRAALASSQPLRLCSLPRSARQVCSATAGVEVAAAEQQAGTQPPVQAPARQRREFQPSTRIRELLVSEGVLDGFHILV